MTASLIVKTISMSHFLDDNPVTGDVELNTIVARADAIVTGKVASQRLDATDIRPGRQPLENSQHPAVDDRRQLLDLLESIGQNADRHKDRVIH